MNTTLIIMAAGIGSRYGKGIKQLAKIAGVLQFIYTFAHIKINNNLILSIFFGMEKCQFFCIFIS